MKIRGLIAGLSFALVLAACGTAPTLPSAAPTSAPAANHEAPPPDSTARSGGAMGSGA